MKLRELTNDGEFMNYLLDNGYTEDAKRLFESQYALGQERRRQGHPFFSPWPYATQTGYHNPNDAVDGWISHYFEDIA